MPARRRNANSRRKRRRGINTENTEHTESTEMKNLQKPGKITKGLYFALGRIAALVSRVFGSSAPQANRANPRGGVALMANEEDGDEAEGSRIVGLANAFQA